ncbi:hypothetical protein [Psychroserpens sp. SPM9]|uniref:hypothetical protein n=1 Tax=Psychroserpens sp. SPM9 TaxID=2975598 RepID=UPI0021A39C8B|nr:hypothetical protein [Psychroserpens sp. SPM9]MDG5491194.1 hypothetical protein [Psychroserpens sp. SPM9]
MESRWSFDDALIIENYKDTIQYTGSIVIGSLVNVEIERISNGPLYIKLFTNEENSGEYIGYDDKFIRKIPKKTEIYVDNILERAKRGETIILPIIGVESKIKSSRPVGYETESTVPILKSGKVSLLNRSVDGNTIYQAGEIELNIGDQFIVDELDSPNYGFISINEEPALSFINRMSGNNAKIIRPGGDEYPVQSSLLNKFLYDDFFRGTSIIFTVLIAIIAILGFYMEVMNYVKNKK